MGSLWLFALYAIDFWPNTGTVLLTGGEWWYHRFVDVAKWGLKLRVIDREIGAETKSLNLNTGKESVF